MEPSAVPARDTRPPRAGAREWIGLAVLALPTTLLTLDITVLNLAVPHLSADLEPSSTQMLWIIDAYGFMIAAFLVTMGSLGDRIGRRRLLMIGAAGFAAASLVAAYATSPAMLIAARAALGIAGATLMPSTLALISNMFRDPGQRGTAIGVWATCFSVGAASGPLVGGLLLEYFWWGSVFLMGVPVMVLLLVTAPFLLPEYRAPGAGRLDMTSVLLSLAAILLFVYGIKELAAYGLSAEYLAALAGGLLLGVVFVRRQRRLADPLLDLRLFADRAFGVALTVLLLGLATLGGLYLLVSQYLQSVQGLSPFQAGLWLLPSALGTVVSSLTAPALARRFGPANVLGTAMVLSAVGCVLLAQAPHVGLLAAMAGFTLFYVGTGPLTVLATDLVVGSAPAEKAGAASSLSETSMEIGFAAGIALLGSLGAVLYRAGLAREAPSDVPAEALESASVSIPAATAEAERLSPEVGEALLEAARLGFTDGVAGAAWVGAVITAVLGVLSFAVLRSVSSGQVPEPSQDTTPVRDTAPSKNGVEEHTGSEN
ncbi:MFS transporter [Nocardiopsis metallicus]|uniref:DHA2 family multidrug resistance protein-like MFS transporter n=1 Tax=Nocardiopsis metallicus TaxID=179819 RepID=A0A840W9I4_9ACTN|nr:MFS transporter [Nocardiopsis metallicus]MBB5489711.1 DHA2 family multidrug resistance protein-like MFS transporter [Nocardiopsis metallicus]